MKHIKKFKESEKDNSSDILEYINNCFIDFKDGNILPIEPGYYTKTCIFLRVDIYSNISFERNNGNEAYNYVDYDKYKKFNDELNLVYNNLYDAIDKVEANYNVKTKIISFREENGISPIYVYFDL